VSAAFGRGDPGGVQGELATSHRVALMREGRTSEAAADPAPEPFVAPGEPAPAPAEPMPAN